MRRLLAVPFEALHVLGMAVFFALAGALTLLSAPTWLAKVSKASPESAAQQFHNVTSLIGRHGWWIGAAAFVGALLAPYVRGDGRRAVAWTRTVCAAVALALVIAAWGAEGSDHFLTDAPLKASDVARWRSDRAPTPWNGLLAATAINLILAASQVTGGAAKKPKGDGGEKK